MKVNQFNFFLYLFFSGILLIYGLHPFYEDQLHIVKLIFVMFSYGLVLQFFRFSFAGSSFYYLSITLLIIFFCSSIYGLIINGITTTVPTSFRYLLVFTFLATVNQKMLLRVSFEQLDRLIMALVLFLTFFGIAQILTGNLVYKTGVYRLSSVYGEAVTGFSLLISTTFLYFYHRFNDQNSIKFFVFAFLCFAMVLGTQSRLAIIACFLLPMIYHLLKLRFSFKSILSTPIVLALLGFLAFLVIAYLNFAPRLLQSFAFEFQDASSQNRIIAWITVIQSLSYSELYIGIGPGGFHHRYDLLTGIEKMDAHFDFVKILVENGLISLVAYFSVLVVFLWILLKKVNRTKSGADALAFIVFLNIFFLSSLHNAFYYFESMMLGYLIIAVVSHNRKNNVDQIQVGASY